MNEPDLLARLRRALEGNNDQYFLWETAKEAADEIERLNALAKQRLATIEQLEVVAQIKGHDLQNLSVKWNALCAEHERLTRENRELKACFHNDVLRTEPYPVEIERLRGLLQEAAHVIIEHECVDVSIDWIDGWAARYRAAVETT